MTKNQIAPDAGEHLEKVELISNRLTFQILSILLKRNSVSFSQLKRELDLNPNSLHKNLSKMMQYKIIRNYYAKARAHGSRIHSFYEVTDEGRAILHSSIGMPWIWRLLGEFRSYCRSKGWRTMEDEDWIEVEGKYHIFLWTTDVHPDTFKRLVSSEKAIIREGSSYRVVKTSYTAWIFLESLSEGMIKAVIDNPEFLSKMAIYDLSRAYLAMPEARKLNKTASEVFREFESFVTKRWKLEFTDISVLQK